MQTFNMEFLGENEEPEAGESGSTGKSACELILSEQADSAKTFAKEHWPWLAAGAAFLYLTRRREK
ncbi:MAG: hypothetical protein WEA79_11130 [Balneolaceae bacterium]